LVADLDLEPEIELVLTRAAEADRVLPADSELAQAIAVLARAQQHAVWDRTQAGNKLRSHLREYYPGFLTAFDGAEKFTSPVARTVLAACEVQKPCYRVSPA
jgi:hypothetical protein